MNGIVIYTSKYGSTKQYAQWLAEDAGFELYNVSTCPKNLGGFDVIVLAGSIHSGFVSIKRYATAIWPSIKDKTVVLILTSGTSNREVIKKVVHDSFSSDIVRSMTVFPVGGRYVFNKMSFIDRNIIKMVAFFTKHQETKKGMMTEKDDVRRENLKEVLSFLGGL